MIKNRFNLTQQQPDKSFSTSESKFIEKKKLHKNSIENCFEIPVECNFPKAAENSMSLIVSPNLKVRDVLRKVSTSNSHLAMILVTKRLNGAVVKKTILDKYFSLYQLKSVLLPVSPASDSNENCLFQTSNLAIVDDSLRVDVYFNLYLRMTLGVPFCTMSFWTKDRDTLVGELYKSIQKEVCIAASSKPTKLYGLSSDEKSVKELSIDLPILSYRNSIKRNPAFLQFQIDHNKEAEFNSSRIRKTGKIYYNPSSTGSKSKFQKYFGNLSGTSLELWSSKDMKGIPVFMFENLEYAKAVSTVSVSTSIFPFQLNLENGNAAVFACKSEQESMEWLQAFMKATNIRSKDVSTPQLPAENDLNDRSAAILYDVRDADAVQKLQNVAKENVFLWLKPGKEKQRSALEFSPALSNTTDDIPTSNLPKMADYSDSKQKKLTVKPSKLPTGVKEILKPMALSFTQLSTTVRAQSEVTAFQASDLLHLNDDLCGFILQCLEFNFKELSSMILPKIYGCLLILKEIHHNLGTGLKKKAWQPPLDRLNALVSELLLLIHDFMMVSHPNLIPDSDNEKIFVRIREVLSPSTKVSKKKEVSFREENSIISADEVYQVSENDENEEEFNGKTVPFQTVRKRLSHNHKPSKTNLSSFDIADMQESDSEIEVDWEVASIESLNVTKEEVSSLDNIYTNYY